MPTKKKSPPKQSASSGAVSYIVVAGLLLVITGVAAVGIKMVTMKRAETMQTAANKNISNDSRFDSDDINMPPPASRTTMSSPPVETHDSHKP